MAADEIRDALVKHFDDLVIAYTVKTSKAESPEQFINDYIQNSKLFEEIRIKHKNDWLS